MCVYEYLGGYIPDRIFSLNSEDLRSVRPGSDLPPPPIVIVVWPSPVGSLAEALLHCVVYFCAAHKRAAPLWHPPNICYNKDGVFLTVTVPDARQHTVEPHGSRARTTAD